MLNLQNENGRLTARLSGDIDHHSARLIRRELDRVIEYSQPQILVLDLEDVGLMDSSGIGLILGRMRAVRAYGGEMIIRNACSEVQSVIRLSGLSMLIEEEKNETSANK